MSSYDKHRPESIQTMFGSIAQSYDRTNAILSFQLHRYWNHALVKHTISKRQTEEKYCIADLCCGTGAISLPWLKKQKIHHNVFLVDFCAEMLECAKNKASLLELDKRHHLSYLNADVQAIPMESNSLDYSTMAYGIRNVNSPAKCFKEVYRVLKKNGRFGILELTEPQNWVLQYGHRFYLKTALPILGRLFAKNGDAYRYLCQSIQSFIKPLELKLMLEEAGFSRITIRPLSGGIATLLIAEKQ